MMNEYMINRLEKKFSQYDENPLDKKVLKSLLDVAQVKSYKKGEIILSVGEKYWQVGYVLSGVIRSYYLKDDGSDRTKHFHIEDQFLMDESLVDYETSICAYEALEDCTILVISAKKMKEIIMKHEQFQKLYIVCLEQGIKYKIARENSFLMQSATERYIEFKKEYPNLEKRVKQLYIATYLGITPESLSRIRRVLREEND